MPEPLRPSGFDFLGALALARRLAALADEWEGLMSARLLALDAALVSWTGPAREEVADRATRERLRTEEVCRNLRLEADRWATAWADAVDDHNVHAWQASLTSDPGSVAPPSPGPVPVPVGPGYSPTAPLPPGALR